MKVQDLINKLVVIREQVGDLPIFVAQDAEGNGFNELYKVCQQSFRKYGREIEVKHPDDAEEGDKPCLVIWP